MSINNLYKDRDILLFKQCYALEKIHGSSAHISFKQEHTFADGFATLTPSINFFSGGEKHETFVKIFNQELLLATFKSLNIPSLTIYGEVYGGKCQGMSATYGKEMKFVAFEVKIGDVWLSVPQAEEIVKQFKLDFVYYDLVETNIETLDKLAEAPSVQAKRNGITEDKIREGIVLRPLIELRKNNGERIIAKHKNDKFKETSHQRKLDTNQLELLDQADKIVSEWVTEMRLSHVLDGFHDAGIEKTGEIVKSMIDDIIKEGVGEVSFGDISSKQNFEIRKVIGRKTAEMFKQRLKGILNE